MRLLQILRTPVPRVIPKLLFLVLAIVCTVVAFLPTEELLIWHLTARSKSWRCRNFEVSAARWWMADSDRNCTMGLLLTKPPTTVFGPTGSSGAVYFEDGSQFTESLFFERTEDVFRKISENSAGASMGYTTQYQPSLGKCAVARRLSPDPTDISMWCFNAQDELVTKYHGAEHVAHEVAEMVKSVKQP